MHTGDAICLNPHMEMLPNIKFEKKLRITVTIKKKKLQHANKLINIHSFQQKKKTKHQIPNRFQPKVGGGGQKQISSENQHNHHLLFFLFTLSYSFGIGPPGKGPLRTITNHASNRTSHSFYLRVPQYKTKKMRKKNVDSHAHW